VIGAVTFALDGMFIGENAQRHPKMNFITGFGKSSSTDITDLFQKLNLNYKMQHTCSIHKQKTRTST